MIAVLLDPNWHYTPDANVLTTDISLGIVMLDLERPYLLSVQLKDN